MSKDNKPNFVAGKNIHENVKIIDFPKNIPTRDMKVAGIIFSILAATLITVIMICSSIAPNYTIGEFTISRLGILKETAVLFNTTAIIVGSLSIIGGYYFYRFHRKVLNLMAFTLMGIGLIGVGIFPMDNHKLHSVFAAFTFIFSNLSILLSTRDSMGVLKFFGYFLSTMGFIYAIIYLIGNTTNPEIYGIIHNGGTERLIVFPMIIWLMIYGGFLYGEAEQKDICASTYESPLATKIH